GYHLSGEGVPSFVYRVGENEVTETILVERDSVVRRIAAEPALPAYVLPGGGSDQLRVEAHQTDHSITVVYSAK
ncbi:MAG: hypothetical protein ACR2RV_17045, partial [Verrucomicrobiales bacterium]